MSEKEAKRFSTAVKEDGVLDLDIGPNSKMFSKFHEALAHKIWLIGIETEFEGEMIDLSHFEFMMASLQMPKDVNRYHLKQFYASMWPYIKKVINSYKSLDQGFDTIVVEQERVLKNYGLQNMELKLMKDFYDDLPNEYRMKFKYYKERHEKKMAELTEKAIQKEKDFRENLDSKQAQKTLERKFKI